MASSSQVRQYLAYWFQLGKPVVVNHGQEKLLPNPVIQGDRYSPDFEACWQQILTVGCDKCHLDGTVQSIGELLDSSWEITPCARCDMPVPTISLGMQPAVCPCFDLPSWPNADLPHPRSPVDSQAQLSVIRDRLKSRQQSSAASNATADHATFDRDDFSS